VKTVNIELTPEGGRYYRARLFWLLTTIILFFPVFFLVVFAILNPFWFREDFSQWLSDVVDKTVSWRSYKQYKIYLGMDPKVWHIMKGER
jgi:positive regulator of sigma E activity